MKNCLVAATVLAASCMAAAGFARGHRGHVHHTGYHASYHHSRWHGHHDSWHPWVQGRWSGWNSYPPIWGNGPGLGWGTNNYIYRNPFWSSTYGGGAVNYAQPITTSSDAADDPPATQVAGTASTDNQDNADKQGDADDDPPNENQKQALTKLDAGRAAFRAGNYAEAQQQADAAISLWPEDVVAHEFRALTLFAQRKYRESAAGVYAVLSGGPGWDEKTLLSFYPDRKTYDGQLAALTTYARQNPNAAEAQFLLAYFQLTAGQRDAAQKDLQKVALSQPSDALTEHLLRSLSGQPPPAK